MQAPLDLSIIIVNWNSAEFVRRCVNSIRRHATGLTCEIIVIDNASFDGCDRMLHEVDPEVRYIQSDTNIGFAKANNLAFEASRGDSLLFLNPDTEITGPAIARLYDEFAKSPATGVVGARLLNGDGTLQTSCVQSFPTILNQVLDSEWLRRRWPKSRLWGTEPLYQEAAAVVEVEAISGACMLIRREVFERIGRFSDDYFMYTEDLDLCYKTRKSGLKNYYVPGAAIVHFGGSSSRQAASDFSCIMMRESIWRFLCKTRGDFYGLGYRCAMLLAAIGRLGLLVLLFPVQSLRGRRQRWMGSFREWCAILRWSLRLSAPPKNCGAATTPILNKCQVAGPARK
jgi:N-acetylglucosaminyl-diphospho-decaprenol L-rhamnosyltransferase